MKFAVYYFIIFVLYLDMSVVLPGGFILGGVVSGLSWHWWTASAEQERTWHGWRVPGALRTLSDARPSPKKEKDKERVKNLSPVHFFILGLKTLYFNRVKVVKQIFHQNKTKQNKKSF